MGLVIRSDDNAMAKRGSAENDNPCLSWHMSFAAVVPVAWEAQDQLLSNPMTLVLYVNHLLPCSHGLPTRQLAHARSTIETSKSCRSPQKAGRHVFYWVLVWMLAVGQGVKREVEQQEPVPHLLLVTVVCLAYQPP